MTFSFAPAVRNRVTGETTKSRAWRKSACHHVMHATEWRLTWWACDVTGELSSKKFMSWGREKRKPVSKYPVAVSNQIRRVA